MANSCLAQVRLLRARRNIVPMKWTKTWSCIKYLGTPGILACGFGPCVSLFNFNLSTGTCVLRKNNDCVVINVRILVDTFVKHHIEAALRSTHYSDLRFCLSHYHSDHRRGLTDSWQVCGFFQFFLFVFMTLIFECRKVWFMHRQWLRACWSPISASHPGWHIKCVEFGFALLFVSSRHVTTFHHDVINHINS